MVADSMGDQRLDLLLVSGVAFEVGAGVCSHHGRAFAPEELNRRLPMPEPAPVTMAILFWELPRPSPWGRGGSVRAEG